MTQKRLLSGVAEHVNGVALVFARVARSSGKSLCHLVEDIKVVPLLQRVSVGSYSQQFVKTPHDMPYLFHRS